MGLDERAWLAQSEAQCAPGGASSPARRTSVTQRAENATRVIRLAPAYASLEVVRGGRTGVPPLAMRARWLVAPCRGIIYARQNAQRLTSLCRQP
eukprot:349990-Chlamydomonas_euryale.AAC.17